MAPQTKATFAHEVLDEIGLLAAEDQTRVRQACGPAFLEIETALSTTWLSEPTFNALNEALREELGDVVFRQIYRRVGRRLVKNRNFQNAIEALVRILGVNPHTLLKLVPKVRASLVKDSGVMTYEKVGPSAARMAIDGFPASTWGLGSTTLLLAGCLEGGVDAMGALPHVQTRDLDLEGGSCVFEVTWQPLP